MEAQKCLIVCFSDGRLCFFNVFSDGKKINLTKYFLCSNANEGLPYLSDSSIPNIDRSLTDPNYQLKIPINVLLYE